MAHKYHQSPLPQKGQNLTFMPNLSPSCLDLLARNVLLAFVTKTVGTRNRPCLSISIWNASIAPGKTFRPRHITPSISKRRPKARGAWNEPNWWMRVTKRTNPELRKRQKEVLNERLKILPYSLLNDCLISCQTAQVVGLLGGGLAHT